LVVQPRQESKFSASNRHRDLNRSATNIPSACRIANIALNDAMILPYDTNPDGIFGKDRRIEAAFSVALHVVPDLIFA
jgi:hypothetical protein